MIRWLAQKWWWWRIGRAIAQAEEETVRYEAAILLWRAQPLPKGLPPPLPDWMQEQIIPTVRHLAIRAAMQARREAKEAHHGARIE